MHIIFSGALTTHHPRSSKLMRLLQFLQDRKKEKKEIECEWKTFLRCGLEMKNLIYIISERLENENENVYISSNTRVEKHFGLCKSISLPRYFLFEWISILSKLNNSWREHKLNLLPAFADSLINIPWRKICFYFANHPFSFEWKCFSDFLMN